MPFYCAECMFHGVQRTGDVEESLKKSRIKQDYGIVNGYSVCKEHFKDHVVQELTKRLQAKAKAMAEAQAAANPPSLDEPCPHPDRGGKHDINGDGDPANDQCFACGAHRPSNEEE